MQDSSTASAQLPRSHHLAFATWQVGQLSLVMQEFIRVGYYVSTEYLEEELREMEPPPNPPIIERWAQ